MTHKMRVLSTSEGATPFPSPASFLSLYRCSAGLLQRREEARKGQHRMCVRSQVGLEGKDGPCLWRLEAWCLSRDNMTCRAQVAHRAGWMLEGRSVQVTREAGATKLAHAVFSVPGSPFSHSWPHNLSPTHTLQPQTWSWFLLIPVKMERMLTASTSVRGCTARFTSPDLRSNGHIYRLSNVGLYLLIRFRQTGPLEQCMDWDLSKLQFYLLLAPCPSRTRILLFPGPQMPEFLAVPYL